jgi:hypothetical protein
MWKEIARRIRGRKDPTPVYVGSHDDKMSRIRPMQIDPDDDQPTREDKDREKAAKRAGGSGGGPPIM